MLTLKTGIPLYLGSAYLNKEYLREMESPRRTLRERHFPLASLKITCYILEKVVLAWRGLSCFPTAPLSLPVDLAQHTYSKGVGLHQTLTV